LLKRNSQQEIQSQAKVTAEKQVEVSRVQSVGAAEITKETTVIKAEQDKEVLIKMSEANKQNAILAAQASKETQQLTSEGLLASQENEAKGVAAIGKATAEAIEAKGLAEIAPQVELSVKIGENKEYQDFLIRQQNVSKEQAVGIAQAEALGKSDVKIIANSGDIDGGIKSFGQAFSAKGGLEIGSMLESFISTPAGEALVTKVVGNLFTKTPEVKTDGKKSTTK